MRHAKLWILAVLAGGCADGPSIADDALLISREEVGIPFRLVGVTVDTEGHRWALSEAGSLFEQTESGWVARYETGRSDFMDVAALEPGFFALTAPNEGFLLDLGTGELRQHFCYVPEEGIRPDPPPVEVVERARAVAFDPTVSMIYANVQGTTAEGRHMFSEVATFDRVSGAEQIFWNLGDDDFSAGGLAVLRTAPERYQGTLLLGEGTTLYTWDMARARRQAILELAGLGVTGIDGLTVDRDAGTAIVLDAATGDLFTLRLSGIDEAAFAEAAGGAHALKTRHD
jgi:hypothetical protein